MRITYRSLLLLPILLLMGSGVMAGPADTVLFVADMYGTDSARISVHAYCAVSEIELEVLTQGSGTYLAYSVYEPYTIPWFTFDGTGWSESDGEHVQFTSALPPGDYFEGCYPRYTKTMGRVYGQFDSFVSGTALDCNGQPCVVKFASFYVPVMPECADINFDGNVNIADLATMIDKMYLENSFSTLEAERAEGMDGYEGVTVSDIMSFIGFVFLGTRNVPCHTEFGNTFPTSQDTLKFSNLVVPAGVNTWDVDVLINARQSFHTISAVFNYGIDIGDIELSNVELHIESDLGSYELHDSVTNKCAVTALNLFEGFEMYGYTPLATLTFSFTDDSQVKNISINPTIYERHGAAHQTVLCHIHDDTSFVSVTPVFRTFDKNPDVDAFGNYCFGEERGNVDGSWDDLVDVGDLNEMIDYLFLSFEPLTLPGEGDVAPLAGPDGFIDIGDITAMIDHLFISFVDLPSCVDAGVVEKRAASRAGDVIVEHSSDKTYVTLDAAIPLRGVQLELSGCESQVAVSELFSSQFDALVGQEGEQARVGVFDMSGVDVIPGGEVALLTLDGIYDIKTARAATLDHVSSPLGIKAKGILPGTFALEQNYPNPFNPSTEIQFSVPVSGHVNLTVYNLLGQEVAVLVDGQMEAGPAQVTWNATTDAGDKVASGVYFYRLTTDQQTASRKMLLLK